MLRTIIWKSGGLLLLLLAGSGFAKAGDSLASQDREKGIQELKKSREALLAATGGLTEEQSKYKTWPDRWSIAEITEHIALTEGFLLQNVKENVLKAPAGAADRDYPKTDAMVLTAIADRSHKAKAPEPVVPQSATLPAALAKFEAARTETMRMMEQTPGLRDHVVDSPLGQPLDGYQWLLFISAHTTRHVAQIAEVKADAGYPRR